MSNEAILTCAVTGAHNNRIDAAKAGVAIVHIHECDPETGKRSDDLTLFRKWAVSRQRQRRPQSDWALVAETLNK